MDFTLTFPALVATRLVLAFSPLTQYLRDDHLLSSPLTSYARCEYACQWAVPVMLTTTQYKRVYTCSSMGLTHIPGALSDMWVLFPLCIYHLTRCLVTIAAVTVFDGSTAQRDHSTAPVDGQRCACCVVPSPYMAGTTKHNKHVEG